MDELAIIIFLIFCFIIHFIYYKHTMIAQLNVEKIVEFTLFFRFFR